MLGLNVVLLTDVDVAVVVAVVVVGGVDVAVTLGQVSELTVTTSE
jgi:hypothetical protein